MLKADVCKEGDTELSVKGDTIELVTDTAVIICAIFNQLSAVDPGAAKEYRTKLLRYLVDPDSYVWQMHEGVTCITVLASGKKDEQEK